jgi:hypothetical protein
MPDDSNQPNSDAIRNFTDAVKTIVNVPKDAVSPKPAEHKTHSNYEEWRCPSCGKLYIKPTQHKHKD